MTAMLRELEHKLWLFPALVVLCASAAFLFGGSCAAWQWHLPLVVVAAWGRWRTARRESVAATALFLAWVAVVWVLCGMVVAPGWFDEGCYHVPAVRMLANGWNPLRTRSPEELAALLGVSMDDCRFWHIAYMARPVWVFNAVAYFFTHDVFHPMLPAFLFVFPATALKLWRTMGERAWWWKLAGCGMLVCISPGTMFVVDAVVALAAVSLFLSFDGALSGRRPDWTTIAVTSFWLMVPISRFARSGCIWPDFCCMKFTLSCRSRCSARSGKQRNRKAIRESEKEGRRRPWKRKYRCGNAWAAAK